MDSLKNKNQAQKSASSSKSASFRFVFIEDLSFQNETKNPDSECAEFKSNKRKATPNQEKSRCLKRLPGSATPQLNIFSFFFFFFSLLLNASAKIPTSW
jgi:hypothetical protein